MDRRIAYIRRCVVYLREPHGGDREAACLLDCVQAALELVADMVTERGAPMPHGYKDACDTLVERRLVNASLAQRLCDLFDVVERLPVWSSLRPGELDRALHEAPAALGELCDVAESERPAAR